MEQQPCPADHAVVIHNPDLTDQEQQDFMISWEVMREDLSDDNAGLKMQLAILRNPRVFVDLPLENVYEAFRRMETIPVAAGEEIMQQGDPGDFLYIIRQGEAEVWQQGLYDDNQRLVAELVQGDHFGEEALLTGGTRNATVKMMSDGLLLRLSADDFQELITHPTLEEVDADAALALLEQGHRILDVRYEEEFEDEHIPDVQLIPLPELRARLDELDPAHCYVTVCHSGKRSAVAVMILKQSRIRAVSLRSGLREWPHAMVEG